MRFRLEATPDELLEKSDQLLKTLHDAVADVAPDAAECLEKALPRKESDLKYPVLRELAKRSSAEYERLTGRMLKEIGKVLDRGPIKKSGELGRELADDIKAVYLEDPDDLSKGWYCGHCGAVSLGDRCEHVQKVAAHRERMKKAEKVEADPNTEPLENDHTQAIAEKDELAYSRVKQVLQGKGYLEADFEEGGPLYGWSVNQLIDLARDKRVD